VRKILDVTLFRKVIYHRRADNVTIRWEPRNGQPAAALLPKLTAKEQEAIFWRMDTMLSSLYHTTSAL